MSDEILIQLIYLFSFSTFPLNLNPFILSSGDHSKSKDKEDDPSDQHSSSPNEDPLNSASTSTGRRKVMTRKGKKPKDVGKAPINGSFRSTLVHHPPSNRSGPPVITITTPDDDLSPTSSDEEEAIEEREIKLVGGSGALAGALERESQQMIATTSSASADKRDGAGDDNQTQRRQLHSTSTMMNVQRNQNNNNNSNPGSSSVVQNHLALTYFTHHEHLHPILQQQQQRRVSEMPSQQYRSQFSSSSAPGGQDLSSAVYQVPIRARDAIATTLSALYGKLIVVMGIAFPMAEVISTYIPPSFYEVTEIRFCFVRKITSN